MLKNKQNKIFNHDYIIFTHLTNFFFVFDDNINNYNLLNKNTQKYKANIQISKKIFNRYYFRRFKEFFKLDTYADFHYCVIYFKFFFFWNFFFLLYWARYKNVIKKFFFNFFYNRNFILFFLNKNFFCIDSLSYVSVLVFSEKYKDKFFYTYISFSSYQLLFYSNILLFLL